MPQLNNQKLKFNEINELRINLGLKPLNKPLMNGYYDAESFSKLYDIHDGVIERENLKPYFQDSDGIKQLFHKGCWFNQNNHCGDLYNLNKRVCHKLCVSCKI